MPTLLKECPELSLTIECFYGALSLEEILPHLESLYATVISGNATRILSDHRHATYQLSSEDIREIAKRVTELNRDTPESQQTKVALLVETPRETALLDLYTMRLKQNNLQHRICSSLEGALDFLEFAPDETSEATASVQTLHEAMLSN